MQPIWGWFAQNDQFAMERPFDPREGVGRMLNGTPPVLGLTAARAGISLTRDAGIVEVAAKARELTSFAIELADQFGLDTDTPRDPMRRGGHVGVHHPDARSLHAAAGRAQDRPRLPRSRCAALRPLAADDPLRRRLRRDGRPRRTREQTAALSRSCHAFDGREAEGRRRRSGMLDAMSVVKINAIQIPEGMGPQLEERFAGRAKMVEQFDGFEDFQLLRPVEGEDRYFVYTRWATEEAFQVWLGSQEFGAGPRWRRSVERRPSRWPASRSPAGRARCTGRRRAEARRARCVAAQLRSRRTRRQGRLTRFTVRQSTFASRFRRCRARKSRHKRGIWACRVPNPWP